MKPLMILCSVALYALLCSCSPIGGGGDDFPNSKVTGKLVTSSNAPANGARVYLIPISFDPVNDQLPNVNIDTTAIDGTYRFSGIPKGYYNIQAALASNGSETFINQVHVADNEVLVPVDTLREPGTIMVMLPSDIDSLYGYVYIPGSIIKKAISGASRSMMLESIPVGTMPAVCYGASRPRVQRVIRYDVQVASGDTSSITNPSWSFSRVIGLNTTITGANVGGTVENFPVLVRLNTSNFHFSDARPNGADLRFAKKDDSRLPYEIERWDAILGMAEIWVRVDTVFGNNNTQCITMYWGNPNTPDSSKSATVFDTTVGFQGVWHLSQAGNTVVIDATINKYDGLPKNMTGASAVSGAIGIAQEFNGVSSYIEMPGTAALSKLDFPEHGIYSISAWVYTDTVDGTYHMIASKGDNQYNLEIQEITNDWEFAECQTVVGWDITNAPAAMKKWTNVVAVRDGERQYLYVDGVVADSTVETLYPGAERFTNYDVMIGKKVNGPSYFFDGKIDEVRISNIALSQDWIRLCYMNQREADALVEFK